MTAERQRTTRLSKSLGWGVVVLVIVVGVLVAWQGLVDTNLSDSGCGVAVALGFALVLSAVALGLGLVTTTGRGRVALVDDGRVIEVRMRARTPLTMLLVGIGFTAFFFAAGIAVGVPGGGVLIWAVGLLFVVLIPDSLMALTRRPALRISADSLELRGWTSDVTLAWADVHTVLHDDSDPIRPRLDLLGRTSSPSFQATSRRLIVPLDRKPRRPGMSVYLAAFDEPDRLRVAVEHLQRMTVAERRSWIGPGAVELLDGTLQR